MDVMWRWRKSKVKATSKYGTPTRASAFGGGGNEGDLTVSEPFSLSRYAKKDDAKKESHDTGAPSPGSSSAPMELPSIPHGEAVQEEISSSDITEVVSNRSEAGIRTNRRNGNKSKPQSTRAFSSFTFGDRNSFPSDATLKELRLSQRRISDGASIMISQTVRAQSFTRKRGSFHKEVMLAASSSPNGEDEENENDLIDEFAVAAAAAEAADSKANETYITCLMDDFRSSLRELGVNPTNPELETWTILVHECLSGNARNFHSVHKVFEICARCDPIQLLGAAFRDTINVTTDGSLSAHQLEYLGPILLDQSTATADTAHVGGKKGSEMTLVFNSTLIEKDTVLSLVFDIFDISPCAVFVKDETWNIRNNVFLSALLFARVFESTSLPIKVVAQVVTAMEATIPFRPADEKEQTALDRLHDRLWQANVTYKLGLSKDELVQSVQRAADLANRNLGNFATNDAATFLDHTWRLMPERSAALRQSFLYTVQDFYMATKDMDDMLHRLKAPMIFQSFRGVPSDREMAIFAINAEENLDRGRTYLRAKLLSIAIISAFCTLTGGDGPMSYFAGDLPTATSESDRLGDSFSIDMEEQLVEGHDAMMEQEGENDEIDNDTSAFSPGGQDGAHQHHYNEEVYNILKGGRTIDQSFDTRNAPLAAYLYAELGDKELERVVKLLTYPMTAESSRKLLHEGLPKHVVIKIGIDMGRLAVTRTDTIYDLLEEIEGDEETAN